MRGPCDDAGTGRDDEARGGRLDGHHGYSMRKNRGRDTLVAGLSAEDLRLEPCVQYMVHAVAVTSCKPPALYSLHYEKKIPPPRIPEHPRAAKVVS